MGTSTLTATRNLEEANRAVVAALVTVRGRATKHAPTQIEFAIGSTRGTAAFSQISDSSTSIQINTRFGHSTAAIAVAIVLFPIGVLLAIIWSMAANVGGVHEKLIAAITAELGGNVRPADSSSSSTSMSEEDRRFSKQCKNCGEWMPLAAEYCRRCGKAP